MIPADCCIVRAQDLFVNQSAMTGESLPVEKYAQQRDPAVANPLELDNILFMGTNVVSGSAAALVITTGNQTYFGALAQRVTTADRTPTQFQAGVNQVAWLLIRFMFVMTPLVLFINGFTKGDWVEALLFALSIAVGLTPEMLPMIVTSTLAKGAVRLSRRKVIVKRLDSIQNFGAMDVLCTDKTGTLTQDKVFLSHHIDVWGESSTSVLEYAYLNSHYQTGLKNLLDVAVLDHAEVHQALDVATAFRLVDEIPFDFQRRRMSVVVAEHEDHYVLICKGAVDEVLRVCTRVQHGETDEPLTDALLDRVRKVTASLNHEGQRVIAVAVKELPPVARDYRVPDEYELCLIGYVAFLDPPKDTAAAALQALAAHGVKVKVLTGDNELVTAKICREVGLEPDGVLLGTDVERMSDSDLAHSSTRTTCSPSSRRHTRNASSASSRRTGTLWDSWAMASMTPPALRTADIGISVDTAVDIAKEAADIILLEKSLMVLDEGVTEGRQTFANMLKYIKMTASSNFGNVFSVLVASAFLPFLPMLPSISSCRTCFTTFRRSPFRSTTWIRSCCSPAAMESRQHRPLHDLLRADQLCLRHHYLLRDVVRVSCEQRGAANLVSIGLVRGRPADADAHRAHDSHAEDPVPPEPRVASLAGDDGIHHRGRHLHSDGAVCALLQAPGAPARLLSHPGDDPSGVHDAHAADEGVLHSPFWLAVGHDMGMVTWRRVTVPS